MVIDRQRVLKVFDDYVKAYDSTNGKIKLKIDHTYRVSMLCERIAESLGMSSSDIDMAYLTGMLHDIGRFEQVRRYGTFNDLKSVDHAVLGVEILFDDGMIRKFIDDPSDDIMIRRVIENHNKYRLDEDLDERCRTFSSILRDADKIDIFKVNDIIPAEEIYNVSKKVLYASEISEEVMENFRRKDTILRTLRRTAADNVASHIALVFGLVYDESIRIVEEQKYLKHIIEFRSENEKTNSQLDEIRSIVLQYISERTSSRDL